MANVTFSDIVMYLEAIANNPADIKNVDDSNHGRFWQGVTRDQFVAGTVPNEDCNGAPIPIVNSDPAQCPLFQALTNATGWCNKGQMPRRGPWITDPGYTVKLGNGAVMKGTDIIDNLKWWITHNMPA